MTGIISGAILGFIVWLSMMLSWVHLPRPIKNFTKKHPVISDITAMAAAYYVLTSVSKSLIAAVGVIVAGLLINLTIMASHLITQKGKNGYSKTT